MAVLCGRHLRRSVVAVQPPSGSDYDVDLWYRHYWTGNLHPTLYISPQRGSAVDLVAYPGGGELYPRAYAVSGGGEYRIQLALTSETLSGRVRFNMSSTDLLHAWNVPAGGRRRQFSIYSNSSTQHVALYSIKFAWYTDRFQIQVVDSGGPGQDEAFTTRLERYDPRSKEIECALAVVNKAGSGTYTLTTLVTNRATVPTPVHSRAPGVGTATTSTMCANPVRTTRGPIVDPMAAAAVGSW
jgi:hypothetical protein